MLFVGDNMKLAINGGKKEIILDTKHYVWPEITPKTKKAVLSQLDESISIYDRSGIIEELEEKLKSYHGMDHALLTNSGTSALHTMFVAANLKSGDEVIAPAYTFHATVTPLFSTGAVPILVDSKSDGNINPASIYNAITDKTKAIIITHMWGKPCDMDTITKIAKDNNLLLFEDGSHAHGAEYNDHKVGSFGDASAFSLQGQKNLTGGEGGFLLTNNDQLYYKSILFGHYNKRSRQEIPKNNTLSDYSLTGMGLKLRIHPLAAAIANEQLDNLDSVLDNRRNYANQMITELSGLPGIKLPSFDENILPSWYAFVMQYDSEQLGGLPISKFYDALVAEGCTELDRPNSTAPLNHHKLFQEPGILFPEYKGLINYNIGDFPVAEKFYDNALKLPVWHKLQDKPLVEGYINAIKKVIKNYKELL